MNLSKNAKKLILNMTMGDGHIDNYGRFICLHSEKQREYLEWKYNLLKEEGVPLSDITYKDNGKYPSYYFRTRTIHWLFSQRKYIYDNGNKVISKKGLINSLDELGLAIWYMDDGSLGLKKNKEGIIHGAVITLNTYEKKSDNQVLIDFLFRKWNIKFNQVKNKGLYRLQCGTKEGRKLFDIIRPYINQIDCMKYKINLLYPVALIKQ